MTEATAADLAELQDKVTALETDHAALKAKVARLTAAANGSDGSEAVSHEDLVALINGIDAELNPTTGDPQPETGDAPAGTTAE